MKILQTEFDSKYFDLFGELMLKTFLAHNKGWEFHVLDFGMTPKQRKIVERVGSIEQAEYEPGNRWSTIEARIAALARLIKKHDTVVHCDGDVLFFDSIEPAVVEVEKSGCSSGYLPTGMKLRQHIIRYKKADELLELDSLADVLNHSALGGVFFVLKPTPELVEVYDYAVARWQELRPVLYTEEALLLCSHLRHHVKYLPLNWKYGWPLHSWQSQKEGYITPSDDPRQVSTGESIVVLHFSSPKRNLTNYSGAPLSVWQAWQHVVAQHTNKTWDQLVA